MTQNEIINNFALPVHSNVPGSEDCGVYQNQSYASRSRHHAKHKVATHTNTSRHSILIGFLFAARITTAGDT